MLAIVVTLLMICFTFLNTASFPVQTVSQPYAVYPSSGFVTTLPTQTVTMATVKITVSFPVFSMGFMAFIGWFLFVLFGGVGLSALPMDMI